MSGEYHRAKKSLGQNFLVDDNVCRRIAEAVCRQPGDRCIEIGPGKGAITRFIMDCVDEYRVIERDDELADRLEEYPELDVVRMDALRYPWQDLDDSWKIAGNLPYNIGSKLIWDIVSLTGCHCVFMVQHEVALRLTADPGSRQYGALTAWVNNFATTKYLFKVPPTVFRPKPKVDSAVVEFVPLPPRERPEEPGKLADLLHMCFQKRRKQLGNILKSKMNDRVSAWFQEGEAKVTDRPENLTPMMFRELSTLVFS
ncbi:16S rRNA (adenine(1518)-N(6)/adenine(1519)-N(6)) -dimethyltransferase RsmA [Salidesulfovibrio brasiliensis]|nr:16S rRNA (adenine(1518)-N(6)/adenine(1519)-N(6))-dimethyltransferase RsmA [Salidesulfovibrio brasiliensis]